MAEDIRQRRRKKQKGKSKRTQRVLVEKNLDVKPKVCVGVLFDQLKKIQENRRIGGKKYIFVGHINKLPTIK